MSGAPIRLAVLGDPLRYTLSPELHRAGLAAAGAAGDSSALPTPPAALAERLAALAAAGYRGVNVTIPHKEAVIAHLARVSPAAERARSVNTVGFDAAGWWGETTDGPGLVDLLATLGRRPGRTSALLLGAGGAARSLAQALAGCGAAVTVSARAPGEAARRLASIPGIAVVAAGSAAEAEARRSAGLLVNATPVDPDPATLEDPPPAALLLDLRYGAGLTAWVRAARARGREAYDGLGLLVFQARRSLALWLGREVPADPLAAAVGWPR